MSFNILEEIWFGNLSDDEARSAASCSLAANTARLRGLRPFPVAAQRLLQMTSTDDYKATAVAEVIEADPALATRLLRVINSAASGLQRPCRTVHGAVTLLGQRHLRRTVLSAVVVMAFGSDDDRGTRILEHSAIVATLCRELARPARLAPEEMYTCGLLHDIGKLMLLQSGDKDYGRLLDDCGATEGAIHSLETERYKFDHAILAGQMLSDWHIPEPIPRVVGWHHNLKRAMELGDAAGPMIHLVHLADRLARAIDSEPNEDYFAQQAVAFDATALGISAAVMQVMWPKLREACRASYRQLSGTDADDHSQEESSDAVASSQRGAGRGADSQRKRAPDASEDQLCALCGELSYGSCCPRCKALVCAAHEPEGGGLCSRCEAEFNATHRDARISRGVVGAILGWIAAACALAALLHARGITTLTQVAPLAFVLSALGVMVLFGWARWSRRAKFLGDGRL
jgi:putative nucleotidyltransferase with HDIG domain